MKLIRWTTALAFALLLCGALLVFIQDGQSGNDFVYATRDIYIVVDYEANVCSSDKVDTIYQVELTQHVKDHHLPGVSNPPAPHDDGHGMTIWITSVDTHSSAVKKCEEDENEEDENEDDDSSGNNDDSSGNNDD